MKHEFPLLSIQDEDNSYLFNIYHYQKRLVGIEEDPDYLQLFEMSRYGSVTAYFDWLRTKTGFGSILDVSGNPILGGHVKYSLYHGYMKEAQEQFYIFCREWGNRLRK